MYEVCGERACKTLLAIEAGDSIAAVARKIDENRETIRRTVNTLEDAGYVVYEDGLRVCTEAVRDAARELLATAAQVSPPTISETYVLPHFTDMACAFTGIDAVYIWTRGGYQVSRSPSDYPLFLAVHASDQAAWEDFFEQFSIPTTLERRPPDEIEGPVQIVLTPTADLPVEVVDGRPVIPLEETLEFAREHYATFQSALDMLDRMYDDVDADANYREGAV